MWIVQLTDFEQDSSITRRPSGTVFFLMAPLSESRTSWYYSMLRIIARYGCLTVGSAASTGSPMASSLDRARDRLGGDLRVA